MRRVFFASRFEKKLKTFHSRHPEFSSVVEAAIISIAKDPYASTLHTHRLKGTLGVPQGARVTRRAAAGGGPFAQVAGRECCSKGPIR